MKLKKIKFISAGFTVMFLFCALAANFCASPLYGGNAASDDKGTKEVSLPDRFQNIDNLKFAIKKLKNMFVSYSTAYNENDSQLKTFISDLVSCLGDCEISAMESAGLSESLAETIVKLKVLQDEQKRIYDQFVRVLDEADVKRVVSNKIVENAQEVVGLLLKNKESPNAPNSIIYKYYGVDAKGHDAINVEKTKTVVRGKSSFFGDAAQNGEASQIMQKYKDDSPNKIKKITAMEFMDPVVAKENATSSAAKEQKKESEKAVNEKTDGSAKEKEEKADGAAKPKDEKKDGAAKKTE